MRVGVEGCRLGGEGWRWELRGEVGDEGCEESCAQAWLGDVRVRNEGRRTKGEGCRLRGPGWGARGEG